MAKPDYEIVGVKKLQSGTTIRTKIGAAYKNKQGSGYSLFFDYFPRENGTMIFLNKPSENGGDHGDS